MKVNDLEGAALDWAVAKCEGQEVVFEDGELCLPSDYFKDGDPYTPSTDWSQGGPIIERERIFIGFDRIDDIDCGLAVWCACKYHNGVEGYGPTPLIAAMRCYVASEMGEEVEVPDELMEGEKA